MINFNNLEKFVVPHGVENVEGNFYFLKDKIFLIKEIEYCEVKEQIIRLLMEYREEIDIEYLVYPEKFYDKNIRNSGFVNLRFILRFIEGATNYSQIMYDSSIPMEEKVKYMKQIGRILKRVHHVSENKFPFFLGDLHEGNCIINPKDDHIYIIDLDGCSIMNHHTFRTKYLGIKTSLFPNKYPVNKENSNYHNKNTDLFCYIMMIINMLAETPISHFNIYSFFEYLNFLKDIGLSYELLDCLSKIYLPEDNESPEELLDQILFCKKDFSFTNFKSKKNIN